MTTTRVDGDLPRRALAEAREDLDQTPVGLADPAAQTIEDDGCFAVVQDHNGELVIKERHTARGEVIWRITEGGLAAAHEAIERLRPSHDESYHRRRRPVTLNVEALVSLRTFAGLSQAELARRSGLSQGHISELERGDKKPREATVKRLADTLQVSMTALLTR